jgi:serine/threonine protein kinase
VSVVFFLLLVCIASLVCYCRRFRKWAASDYFAALSAGKEPQYPTWLFPTHMSSPLARSLLVQLLHPDPLIRPTAADALKHRWMNCSWPTPEDGGMTSPSISTASPLVHFPLHQTGQPSITPVSAYPLKSSVECDPNPLPTLIQSLSLSPPPLSAPTCAERIQSSPAAPPPSPSDSTSLDDGAHIIAVCEEEEEEEEGECPKGACKGVIGRGFSPTNFEGNLRGGDEALTGCGGEGANETLASPALPPPISSPYPSQHTAPSSRRPSPLVPERGPDEMTDAQYSRWQQQRQKELADGWGGTMRHQN